MEALRMCFSRSKASAWQLCREAGLINSLHVVIGSKAVIRTKQFYFKAKQHVKTRFHWNSRFRRNSATSSTMKFLAKRVEKRGVLTKFFVQTQGRWHFPMPAEWLGQRTLIV